MNRTDTNHFFTENSEKKFELSTTDEAGRVHAITVCANTSSEICDHMLALSPSDQLSSSLCVLLMY